MNDLEFTKPGKSYKQVKTVSMSLCDSRGEITGTKVTVYLSTAGTPSFAVGLPKEYADYVEANKEALYRDREGSWDGSKIVLADGSASATTFDALEPGLKWLSNKVALAIKNRKITKVIVFNLALKTPAVAVNAPSFTDGISHLVGLGAEIRYEVNGNFYWNRSAERTRDAEEDYAPAFEDLQHASRHGQPRCIPFNPVTWKTLQEIQGVLQSAARALEQLKDPETAAALLSSGTMKLLA